MIYRLEFSQENSNDFTVHFGSKEIRSKTTEKISISFHPMSPRKYKTRATFYVNSKSHSIVLRGEGVPLLLELVDESDKFVVIEQPTVGKSIVKTVRVVNRSRAPVVIFFDLYDRLPIFGRTKKSLKPEFDVAEERIEAKK